MTYCLLGLRLENGSIFISVQNEYVAQRCASCSHNPKLLPTHTAYTSHLMLLARALLSAHRRSEQRKDRAGSGRGAVSSGVGTRAHEDAVRGDDNHDQQRNQEQEDLHRLI